VGSSSDPGRHPSRVTRRAGCISARHDKPTAPPAAFTDKPSAFGQSQKESYADPAIKRQLPQPFALGDLADVEAYVRAIVATLTLGEGDEFAEYVADGLELVVHRQKTLAPGQSLKRSLDGWLRWRLQDRWRERHDEWRRNSRGATAYALLVPTGLAWEHPEDEGAEAAFAARDERGLIDSRLALEIFISEADLRDPNKVGRYRGVPSWAGLATGRAQELWAQIEEERQLTDSTPSSQPPPFSFEADVL